jgi:peptidoglycan/xylan/chitin deacetylase (PgdA/CDA1 family)
MESSDDEGEPATAGRFMLSTLFILLFFPSPIKKQEHSRVTTLNSEQDAAARKATPPKTAKKKTAKKKLYITFDDGPNKCTDNVLNITRDEGTPVTFFIVGEHVFASSLQTRSWDSLQIAKHIEICNHSYTHGWNNRYNSFYENPDSVVKDFDRAQDSLQLKNSIARTPGRNIWRIDSIQFTDLKKSAAAADSLMHAGFTVMGWDLEWHYDPKTMSVTTPAEKLVQEIDSLFANNKTKQPGHLVLLAHDQVYCKSSDSFQLRQFLQLIRKKPEYELSLATDYPGVQKLIPDSIKSRTGY